jgi:large subunit ribosomal protein L29
MKVTIASDLRKLQHKSLMKRIAELKRELMNLRFQKSGGQLQSTKYFRIVRREIARIKTVLTEKNKKLEIK